ncbi:helix-turn-helix transcriptional regulator, partial [Streptomyces sp. NPDC079189]
RVVIEREVLALPSGILELSAALSRDEQCRVVEAGPGRPRPGRRPVAARVHYSMTSSTGMLPRVALE